MSIQFKLAAGALAAAAAGHTYHVLTLRSPPSTPPPPFFPGSADFALATSLRAGDVLLFDRDCSTYLLGGGVCAVRKGGVGVGGGDAPFGAPFTPDHVGLVVLRHGEPWVAECTSHGPELRRFDARVRTTRSGVRVRRVSPPLPPPEADSLLAWAQREAGGGGGRWTWAKELVSSVVRGSAAANAATSFVGAGWAVALGVPPPPPSTTPTDWLEGQPLAAAGKRLGGPTVVRQR